MTYEDLNVMQGWNMQRKIQVAQTRIIEAIERWNGNGIISFSGGKDSTVLLDLARRAYPEIKAVFVDTGLEFPEIVEFVKTFNNVDIIRPQLCGDKCTNCELGCFGRIVREVGWNFPSKDVSHTIYYARKCLEKGTSQWAMNRLNGVDDDLNLNKYRQSHYVKWKFLLDSPFLISDKCCVILKEKPLDLYYKAHNKALPIVGTMAEESRRRREAWLKTGCNAFDSKKPISKPMSFWTEQDVLQYIKLIGIPIASCYGEIVENKNGRLRTTGESRTGCCLCPVGCHLGKENRFMRMQKTHPELWEKAVKLGLPELLDYVGVDYNLKEEMQLTLDL